jgi:hypothetical protein
LVHYVVLMKIARFAATVLGVGMALGISSPAFAEASLVVAPAVLGPGGGNVAITPACTEEGETFISLTGEGPLAGIENVLANQIINVPAGTAAGSYDVTLLCVTVGATTSQAVQTLTIGPSGPPQTGGGGSGSGPSTAGIVALGTAALVGAGLFAARRRRLS